jgi:hypothetical protein
MGKQKDHQEQKTINLKQQKPEVWQQAKALALKSHRKMPLCLSVQADGGSLPLLSPQLPLHLSPAGKSLCQQHC